MQNQQLSDVKGKELVAAGHAFDKAIGMDTPLIEIAKMMAQLATRLDCALVRGDAHKQDVITWEKSMMAAIGEDGVGSVGKAIAELKAQRDALAAENAALNSFIAKSCYVQTDTPSGWGSAIDYSPETAETNRLSVEESQFLTDVITAAGLLSNGKRDKALARRIADFCVEKKLNSKAAQLRAGEPS